MPTNSDTDTTLLSFYENGLELGRKIQSEYSRWLINTLYLLHSGAIVGIISRAPIEKIPQYSNSLWWFVCGLALAFLTGLATWSNYELYVRAHLEVIKHIRERRWHPGQRVKAAMWTHYTTFIALAVGLASFVCLLAGAWSALHTLSSAS